MKAWLLALVVLVAVAGLGAGFWILRPGGSPLAINYYRVVDEDTLIIGTDGRRNAEVRVTRVIETPDSVEIVVQPFDHLRFGFSAEVTYPIELTVDLDEPLANRAVFSPHGSVEEFQ